ncbi:AAA family ATPase [bacterium]|nr:AAA family ATPase [bacterium]
MIQIKDLTVKNFMSVGNATQAINFDRQDLTLVLGENIDLGGDGSRNGTGKTTIINALSYALYGEALTNIRRDNLINKTNSKGMMVSLDFCVGEQCYRIERGRKPNVLKFYINDSEQEADDYAQGDSRETQGAILKLLSMSHTMFKHLVALNTYTEPFLSLKQNDQREIIEQLLGITQLSERADKIKELSKRTRDDIKQEEMTIKALQTANDKIGEQVQALKRRQTLWMNKKAEDVKKFETAIEDLAHVDIDAELAAQDDLLTWTELNNTQTQLQKDIAALTAQVGRAEKDVTRTKKALDSLESGTCGSCGQSVDHMETHQQHVAKAQEEYNGASDFLREIQEGISALKADKTEVPARPRVFYDSVSDAHNHRSTLSSLETQLQSKRAEADPYVDQIVEMQTTAATEISYDKLNDLTRLYDHQDFLLKLLTNKDSFVRKRIIDQNLSYLNSRLTHYLDRIGLPHTVIFQNDLTVEIQELGRDLDFDNLSRGERNRLIISMSWAFRDVWESLYGAINLLFIDEMIDSGMDTSGVEAALALLKKMARERSKSIWLVSHKDELAGRVNNLLKVVKENGFTSYSTDIDIA